MATKRAVKKKPAVKHTNERVPTHPVKPVPPGVPLDQLERVRRFCLAMPGAIEKLSHGEPTFFTPKRVFAAFSNNHHNDGHIALLIPAEEGQQAELIKSNPRIYFRPAYVGVAGWVGIELPEIDDEDLGVHVLDAWRIITAKQKRS